MTALLPSLELQQLELKATMAPDPQKEKVVTAPLNRKPTASQQTRHCLVKQDENDGHGIAVIIGGNTIDHSIHQLQQDFLLQQWHPVLSPFMDLCFKVIPKLIVVLRVS